MCPERCTGLIFVIRLRHVPEFLKGNQVRAYGGSVMSFRAVGRPGVVEFS